MKKIFSKVAFTAAFIALASGSAQAAPSTFQFDISQWSYESDATIFGSGSILKITVDNGSTNTASQTYLNSQITALSVQAVGGTYNHSWTNSGATSDFFDGQGNGLSESYLSTDANGIPTLNLLASPDSSTTDAFNVSGSDSFLQLGIIGTGGGSTSYVVGEFSPFQIAYYFGPPGNELSGFAVTGELAGEQAVPEPASIALIGLGLMGAGAMRRRKKKSNAG